MKNIMYILLAVIALVCFVPQKVSAATKVESPTITLTFDKTKDRWYITFNHPNKKAIVYYKRGINTQTYRKAVVGKKYKVTKDIEFNRLRWYAKVGNKKSVVKNCSFQGLQEKQVMREIRKDIKTIINDTDDDFTKLCKIMLYFRDNYDYGSEDTRTMRDRRGYTTYYRKVAVCEGLACCMDLYFKVAGLESEVVFNETVDYTYQSPHAWNHVYIDGQLIALDPTSLEYSFPSVTSTIGFVKTSKYDLTSYRDCYKVSDGYFYSVLDKVASPHVGTVTYSKNNIIINYSEKYFQDYNVPVYDRYYSIFTYSADDGYWTRIDYTMDGVVIDYD